MAIKSKPLIISVLLAMISVLLVGITYQITQAPIAINQREAVMAALDQIIPPAEYDHDLIYHKKYVTDALLGSQTPLPAYFAYKDHHLVGVIFTVVAPNGYSGAIKLLVGVYADAQLAGVRAIAHSETPGLGDKMDVHKTDWVYSFNNKSLENTPEIHWRIIKEGGVFESWTGASITPKAIIQAVHNTLTYVEHHKEQLGMGS